MTLTPCGAVLSVVSPQGGVGRSLSCGRRGSTQATTSCPISRRAAITGSAIGRTTAMTTIRQPVGCSPMRAIIGRSLGLLADPAGEPLAADNPDPVVTVGIASAASVEADHGRDPLPELDVELLGLALRLRQVGRF